MQSQGHRRTQQLIIKTATCLEKIQVFSLNLPALRKMTFKTQHPVLSLSQLAVEHGWENAGREGLITSFVSPHFPISGLEGAWFTPGFMVCPADAVSELVSYLL